MNRLHKTIAYLGIALGLTGCAHSPPPPPASSFASDEAPAWQDPTSRVQLWRTLAHWYLDNGLPNHALDMVQRLQRHGVSDPEFDLVKARALVSQGLAEEAKSVLTKVLAKEGPTSDTLLLMGIVYSDLGDLEQARGSFEAALELNPYNPQIYNNLGFVSLIENDCRRASELFESAVELDGVHVRYRNNLGFALVCAGNPKRALSLFRSTSTEPDARYNMGLAYERIGEYTAATLQYERAVSADNEHEAAQQALARLSSQPSPPNSGSLQ